MLRAELDSPKMARVRFLQADQPYKRGDLVEFPLASARRLAKEGRAEIVEEFDRPDPDKGDEGKKKAIDRAPVDRMNRGGGSVQK